MTLDARVATRGELRYTPAGIPALDFAVEHESMQHEAGGERRVACEIAAVALGAVAKEIADLPAGAQIRCRGFLARRYRTGTSVALHVNEFEPIDRLTERTEEY